MELKFGDVIINKKNKIVISKNVNIDFILNEYNLLIYLFENIDRVVFRDELLNKIWGYDIEVEIRVVDDIVKRLCKKILNINILIEIVWGFGFRLKEKS